MKATLTLAIVLLAARIGTAADWPAWRHDAQRSAATQEQLAAELHLQWSLRLPRLQPAWPEDPRLQFDASYEPIVSGGLLFVASSHDDSIMAFDATSGELRWRYYADGPVRVAPIAWNGNLYFGADDGKFRCLDVRSGEERWTFNAAPADRLAIGNERLVSVWPIRTSPVVRDEKVYFTAGVWPFEGTLLYGLDAFSGREMEVFDLQDQAPQGYLVESQQKLFIPGGRAKAYALDLTTRDPLALNYDARGTSDCYVTACDQYLFHGDVIVDADENSALTLLAHRPVSADGEIYFVQEGTARAADLHELVVVPTKDRRGNDVELKSPTPLWQLDDIPVTSIHCRAGSRLYAHHENQIMAIDLPQEDGQQPTVSWQQQVEGTVTSMLVADQKLFVVTNEGAIYCFGAQSTTPTVHEQSTAELPQISAANKALAKTLIGQTSVPRGYCLVLGIGDGELIEALAQRSSLHIIAIDSDAKKIRSLRESMSRTGRYGTRVVAKTARPQDLTYPPYLASLVTSADIGRAGFEEPESFAYRVFETLRPYGGAACFPLDEVQHGVLESVTRSVQLPNLELNRRAGLTVMRRVGPLPDTADWTHEYGDPGNTLMSPDKLVRAPLGVLWFGGPSSDGSLYFDRHDWAPSLEVIDGRMLIQGPQKLTAVDVYTGQVMWQNSLPTGISPGRTSNWDPSGYHFATASDGVYVALPQKCLRYDPATGQQLAEYTLPDENDQWGRVQIWKDRLIVPAFRQQEGDDEPRPLKLYALDRQSGRVAWSKESELGFPLLAIGDDRLFCYEGKLAGMYRGDSERRRGGVPAPITDKLFLRSLDVTTGEELWTMPTTEPASWLSFSAEYDVLLMSSRDGITALQGRTGETLWSKKSTGEGFRGHPENYWDKVIIWHDQILDQRGPGKAYRLLDGEPVTQANPLTGTSEDWEFTKVGHHCNYAVANESLLTFAPTPPASATSSPAKRPGSTAFGPAAATA